jgi:hypothetical protein
MPLPSLGLGKASRSETMLLPPPKMPQRTTNTSSSTTRLTKEQPWLWFVPLSRPLFLTLTMPQRNHIAEKPLHAQSDRLRDLVEKLLAVFLTDPLADPVPSQEPAHPVATPGGKPLLGVFGSTHGHASPFDLPSGSRPPIMRSKTEGHIHTGSPVSRRKTGGGMLDGS